MSFDNRCSLLSDEKTPPQALRKRSNTRPSNSYDSYIGENANLLTHSGSSNRISLAESCEKTTSSFNPTTLATLSFQEPFRLGFGYMSIMFCIFLVSHIFLVYYAIDQDTYTYGTTNIDPITVGASRYFAFGQIFFPISLACLLILFVAHPRDKTWVSQFMSVYLIFFFVVYDAAGFIDMVFTNPIQSTFNTEHPLGLASIFPILLFFCHIPFSMLFIKVRRLIGKFKDKKLTSILTILFFFRASLPSPLSSF
ncbi:hypothetical protein TrLO_g878 [Triparma laevis f. longispina]|uniref:Uncharacterized protein n=1 Tax=Triparma laevis f. longispina TaxID=1714387 RepID=A0A9W6Z6J7_9STRA|nr:hypothetical protein TrLO_g878 [Triparma laevis f. longispina]